MKYNLKTPDETHRVEVVKTTSSEGNSFLVITFDDRNLLDLIAMKGGFVMLDFGTTLYGGKYARDLVLRMPTKAPLPTLQAKLHVTLKEVEEAFATRLT